MSRVRRRQGVRQQSSHTTVAHRPPVEGLENRILFATRIWDGGSIATDNWSDAKNWASDVAPKAGDELVFPSGIRLLDRSTRNNFGGSVNFNSIAFEGFGYTVRGNPIAVGAGGIRSSIVGATSSSPNTIKADVRIDDAATPFVVSANAPNLVLENVISGTGGIVKTGAGTLVMNGKGINSFDGLTVVRDGTLELGRTPVNGGISAFAVNDVVIGQGIASATPPRVVTTTAGQIRDDVTINGGRLDIRRFEELDDLTMFGGDVIGPGRLAVGERPVIGQPNDAGELTSQTPAAGVPAARIRTASIDVHGDIITNAPLVIESIFDDGSVRKLGPSYLALRGTQANRMQSPVRLDEGVLRLGKSPGVAAITAELIAAAGTRVVLESSDQIRDTAKLNLNGGAVFDLGAFSEKIGPLNLGGTIQTSANGVVTLLNDVSQFNFANPKILGRLDLGGAARTFNFSGNGELLIAANITGTRDLIKTGGGRMVLTGTSNFSGKTVLNAGTLVINGQQFNSTTNVNGGTLFGVGRIGGLGASAGVISPGATADPTSTGTLLARELTLVGSSTLQMRLAGTTPGTQFDQITTTTSDSSRLILGGVLDVRLASEFAPAVGTSFRIIDNQGSRPVFAGVFFRDTQGKVLDHDGAAFTSADGTKFAINYHGGDGNDVVITRDGNAIL